MFATGGRIMFKKIRKRIYQRSLRRTRVNMRSSKRFWSFLWPGLIIALIISLLFSVFMYDQALNMINDSDEVKEFLEEEAELTEACLTRTQSKNSGITGKEYNLKLARSDSKDQWKLWLGDGRRWLGSIAYAGGYWCIRDLDTGEILYSAESEESGYCLRVEYDIETDSKKTDYYMKYFYDIPKEQKELVEEVAQKSGQPDGFAIMIRGVKSAYVKGTEAIIESYLLNDSIEYADLSGFDLEGYTHLVTTASLDVEKRGLVDRLRGKDGNIGFTTTGVWNMDETYSKKVRDAVLKKVSELDKEKLDEADGVIRGEMRLRTWWKWKKIETEYGTFELFMAMGEDDVADEYKSSIYKAFAGVFISVLASFCFCALIIAVLRYRRYRVRHELFMYRTTLTNMMAHDLKTPLTAVSIYSENIASKANPEKDLYYSQEIRKQVKHVRKMLDDIAKTEEESMIGDRTEIWLAALCKEVIANVGPAYDEKKITVSVAGDTKIFAERSAIETVIRNLIDNAYKYSSENDTIKAEISSKTMEISNPYHGEEISKPEKLLMPFVRGDRARTGSGNGLGLAIVKNICDLTGIRLKVKVKDNSFSVRLLFGRRGRS